MFIDSPLSRLSHEQLEQYLDRIETSLKQLKLGDEIHPVYDNKAYIINGDALPSPTLHVLTKIVRAHATHIPFGNAGMVYFDVDAPNWAPTADVSAATEPPMNVTYVSTELEHIFHKLIHRKLDAYCYEQNELLAAALRTLGFTVWSGKARVSSSQYLPDREYTFFPLYHQILFVLIDGQEYLCDVAYGGVFFLAPIPIRTNEIIKGVGLIGDEVKFERQECSPSAARPHTTPVFGTSALRTPLTLFARHNSDADFVPHYCFTDDEFFPVDYVSANIAQYSVRGLFSHHLLVQLPDKDGRGKKTLFDDTFKILRDGVVIERRTLTSEAERIQVLKEHFHLEFTEKELRSPQACRLSLDK
ncbi:uncharacterized protein VTP21DRAFT_9056 [Calcarisporiella thermophila]|uniref:uncharacterized protein n=1 Tax=Calcarisporiella thermophila TaxID=911321 RepID=UPI003743985E